MAGKNGTVDLLQQCGVILIAHDIADGAAEVGNLECFTKYFTRTDYGGTTIDYALEGRNIDILDMALASSDCLGDTAYAMAIDEHAPVGYFDVIYKHVGSVNRQDGEYRLEYIEPDARSSQKSKLWWRSRHIYIPALRQWFTDRNMNFSAAYCGNPNWDEGENIGWLDIDPDKPRGCIPQLVQYAADGAWTVVRELRCP